MEVYAITTLSAKPCTGFILSGLRCRLQNCLSMTSCYIRKDFCRLTQNKQKSQDEQSCSLLGGTFGTPPQYSCLENPTEEPGRLQSMGSLRVGHDWVTSLSLFTFMHWRRKWQSTPVFLPGESQGRGKPGGLPSMGSHRFGQDWSDLATAAAAAGLLSVSNYSWNCSYLCRLRRRAGQPTPVFLPGESYGQRNLTGYSP